MYKAQRVCLRFGCVRTLENRFLSNSVLCHNSLFILIPVRMTLTFTQGHRVARKLELVQSFCCNVVYEGTQIFAVVDHVHGETARKGCKYGEYGQFEHSVFLFLCFPMLLFVGCLTSQQQASVSQGRICTDNFTSCHTEIEAADQTFHLTQSQYTDTGPTSPSADPITPGVWQGSHWSANV